MTKPVKPIAMRFTRDCVGLGFLPCILVYKLITQILPRRTQVRGMSEMGVQFHTSDILNRCSPGFSPWPSPLSRKSLLILSSPPMASLIITQLVTLQLFFSFLLLPHHPNLIHLPIHTSLLAYKSQAGCQIINLR